MRVNISAGNLRSECFCTGNSPFHERKKALRTVETDRYQNLRRGSSRRGDIRKSYRDAHPAHLKLRHPLRKVGCFVEHIGTGYQHPAVSKRKCRTVISSLFFTYERSYTRQQFTVIHFRSSPALFSAPSDRRKGPQKRHLLPSAPVFSPVSAAVSSPARLLSVWE